jgi:hypothetical protein
LNGGGEHLLLRLQLREFGIRRLQLGREGLLHQVGLVGQGINLVGDSGIGGIVLVLLRLDRPGIGITELRQPGGERAEPGNENAAAI